ncbi:MAG: HAMP domain-containing protein [Candidatus Binatia bacterium]
MTSINYVAALLVVNFLPTGGFIEDRFNSVRFAVKHTSPFEDLISSLPPGIYIFVHYLLDGKLWLFGGMALFGTFMAIVLIKQVAQTVRQQGVAKSRRSDGGRWKTSMSSAVSRLSVLVSRWRAERKPKLVWRMIGTFIGIVLVIGLGTIGSVYYVMSGALRSQMQQTTLAIAVNLSDAAAPYVLRKDVGRLRTLMHRYGEFADVAYAFIEDRKGIIMAHNPKNIPPKSSGTIRDFRDIIHETTLVNGQPAFVTRVPLMNAEMGAVHVAIWQSAMQREIYHVLFPILRILLLILLASFVLVFFIARRISKPILSLARTADQISHGNFDAQVAVNSTDELGELARSMGRLRSSLKAAMTRLNI